MARTLSKGATITLRLPLAVDAAVRARAESEHLSVGDYAANVICRAVVGNDLADAAMAVQHASNKRTKAPRAAKPAGNRIDSDEADGNASTGLSRVVACEHRDRVVIGGGMARCKACGAMRDVRGNWKVVH